MTTIVGSRNTRRATEATIAAGAAATATALVAAREERLWDKRCAAYEATVSGLLYRQEKRQQDYAQTYQQREVEAEQELKDFFASYEPPGWVDTRARLVSYASDAVLVAFNGSQRADFTVWRLYQNWLAALEDSRRASESENRAVTVGDGALYTPRRDLGVGIREAGVQDKALIDVIRDELRSKPEAAALPAPVPAELRRFLHRYRR